MNRTEIKNTSDHSDRARRVAELANQVWHTADIETKYVRTTPATVSKMKQLETLLQQAVAIINN